MAQLKELDSKIYNRMCEKIKSHTPFTFTRWGDGEWFNIEKRPGKNCDGNIYYHDLGDELRKIVEVKQPYYMGKQRASSCYSIADKYNQDWIHADLFHWASIDGVLNNLIDSLKAVHVVYIGNKDLKNLPFVDEFIEIPKNNVWLIRDEVIEKIRATMTDEHKTYCFSAGMAANVLIHRLWEKNPENTYIDVGSVFDPYVGKCTRRYHQNIKVQK